ncbi:unnamed protein product [Cunninghamella echinulata]
MQDAEAGSAHDYRKRKHVIRLSVDLDHRKMPQFITSNRRRRRRGRLYHDPNHQTPSRYREGSLI